MFGFSLVLVLDQRHVPVALGALGTALASVSIHLVGFPFWLLLVASFLLSNHL